MVFIWAKILAVDSVRRLFAYKCTSHKMHEDVCKDNYFFRVSNENTRAMFMKAELVSYHEIVFAHWDTQLAKACLKLKTFTLHIKFAQY